MSFRGAKSASRKPVYDPDCPLCNSPRSQDLIARHLPKFLRSLGADFAGVKGSRIYKALHTGELSYRSYCFEKAAEN
jgi:hypothetical protein